MVLAEQVSDFVVVLGLDGKIVSQGSMSEALKNSSRLRSEVRKQTKDDSSDDKDASEEKGDEIKGKLILKEELEAGHLSWKAGTGGR